MSKLMQSWGVWLVLGMLLAGSPVAAQNVVYKWVDERGTTQYTQTPPVGRSYEQLGASSAPAPAATTAGDEGISSGATGAAGISAERSGNAGHGVGVGGPARPRPGTAPPIPKPLPPATPGGPNPTPPPGRPAPPAPPPAQPPAPEPPPPPSPPPQPPPPPAPPPAPPPPAPPPPEPPPPSPPGGGDWPNEPAGFTAIRDQPFDTLPEHHVNPDPLGWAMNPSTNLIIVQDSTAPGSPDNVARTRVREGQGGTGGHNIWTGIPSERRAHEIYFSQWRKFPLGYVPNPGDNKDWWFGMNRGFNGPYTTAQGPTLRVFLKIQGHQFRQPDGSLQMYWRNMAANRGPESHRHLANFNGQWHRAEWYLRMNTINERDGDLNRADGIVRAWITAGGETHLVLEYTDVKFLDIIDGQYYGLNGEPSTGTFTNLKWNPIYGGHAPSPFEQFYYTDHVRISGP